MIKRFSKRDRCHGAVLVEFALLLPVVLLFITGMIEVSRVLLLQHTVDAAAYEGARAGMVPGATAAEARDAATVLLRAAKLKGETISVTPEEISESTPLITVQVEVPLSDNSWTSSMWYRSLVLKSEVTLFCERPPMVQLTGVPSLKLKGANAKKVKGAAL